MAYADHATHPLHIRSASLDDVDEVLDLLAEAAAWTAAVGHPNWPAEYPRRPIASAYETAGFVHCRDVEGEFVSREGTRHHWRTSLYERTCRQAGSRG